MFGQDIIKSLVMLLAVLFAVTSSSSTAAFVINYEEILHPNRNSDVRIFELSVIHFNDFHARFVETNRKSETCSESDYREECVGGIARLYTASKRLLNERPNAILLNAGDNFQGTLWYNVHRWNVTAALMNTLPQDAMTLGNHEFDDRIAGLVPFLRNVNATVVVTNIDATEEPEMQHLFVNSTIIERNGTKIGVVGVITTDTTTMLDTGKLRFLDEVESVNAEAKRLKNRGIDVIIVLSHVGLSTDRIMASNCPNVDLIVGGHSHTFLYSGTPPSSDVPADEYPVVVKQRGEANRTVLIVQAAAFTKYLGNLTVRFDRAGEIIEWEGNPIFLDKTVEQDAEILAALLPWRNAVDELDSTVIGYTDVALNNDCHFGECNLGNLIADAMVDAYVDKAFLDDPTYWTYASVACTNAGGIHVRSSNRRGNITYSDAMYHQLYKNTWDVLELRGSDIVQVLEHSVSESYSPSVFIGKHFLQWSGIKVTFDIGRRPNSRVKSLTVRCQACRTPVYEDVVPEKWYRIVVPSILAKGGDGYTVIRDRNRNRETGILNTDYYPKYINKTSPITIGVEGRITFTKYSSNVQL